MRLLVTADTHLEQPDVALPLGEADAVVHAGDFTSVEVLDRLEEDSSLHAVHGNADDGSVRAQLPRRRTFEADGVCLCVVHGDRTADVAYEAVDTGADLLVRGHTHTPSYKERTAAVLNPGSPSRPRNSPPSYAWLVCEDGRFGGRIVSTGGDTLLQFGEEL